MDGYSSPLYALSLAEFGTPVCLPACGGWLLERSVAGTPERDLTGCYPLFSCNDWSRLGEEIERLNGRAASLSMVVDPFCNLDPHKLAEWFPDVCRPFKEHYVVDFSRDWRGTVARHHRRNVRAAAQHVDVQCDPQPLKWLTDWTELYAHLIERHDIRGVARFSSDSLARQLSVPGAVAFRACCEGASVGMLVWFRVAERAYYHLGAFSEKGYAVGAAFALFESALSFFAKEGMHWAGLGGATGWKSSADDGLARFKAGWANGRITAWFCGRILAPDAYRRLVALRRIEETEFFPAYRLQEAA